MAAGCDGKDLCYQQSGAEVGGSLLVWGQLGLPIELRASQGYIVRSCLKKKKKKEKSAAKIKMV